MDVGPCVARGVNSYPVEAARGDLFRSSFGEATFAPILRRELSICHYLGAAEHTRDRSSFTGSGVFFITPDRRKRTYCDRDCGRAVSAGLYMAATWAIMSLITNTSKCGALAPIWR